MTAKNALALILTLALASCGGSRTPAAKGAAAELCPCGADPNRSQIISREFLRPGDARTFQIQYRGQIAEVPPGTRVLQVWIPVPQDTNVQTIRNLSFSREAKLADESKYGNKVAFWKLENPAGPVEITMTFECTRQELRTDLDRLRDEGRDEVGSFEVFRKPDRLVLVDSETARISDGVCQGKTSTLDRARAIYDYVVSKMTYDKNHKGWGLGSTRHACDVGMGNCTDFHALFNSLCRSQAIASGFEIGLYLPYDRKSEEKPGSYHCWALFRAPGKTWVPVDCSEASRVPARRDYFFGNLTSNRVTLSTGRDLTLVPEQAGPPLNFFLDPYAEADGKPLKTAKTWTFKDLD